MENLRQKTISGVKWSMIEKYSVQIISFIIGIILARLLSPSDFGTIGMIGVFFAISSTFIDSGLGNALIRKQNRTEDDFSTIFWFNLIVSLICFAVLFFSAPLVADFFDSPILVDVMRVMALNLVIGVFAAIPNAKLTIDVNFKVVAQRSLFSTVISGIIGIYMAYVGWGVWSLVFQMLMGTFIEVLFLNIYCRWSPSFIFSKKSFHEMFSYGSKLLLSSLLNRFYDNLTPIVIGKFYKPADLGFYTKGCNTASLPVQNISGVLQRVTFPILAKIQDDDERLIRVYRKYIAISSIPIFFSCTLLAAMAKPLVVLLFTEKWLDSVIFVQIFAFAIMFDHICTINLNLLQVKGRSDLFLKLEIVKKTISILILLASIPFGVIAICISKIIYTQIAVYINTYYTGKLFNLGYLTQIKDFGKYFLFSVVACFPTLIMCNSIAIWWISIPLGMVLSVTLYYSLLHNDDNMKEIVLIFTNKVKSYKQK